MMKQAGVFLLALTLVTGVGVPAQAETAEIQPKAKAGEQAQEKSAVKKYPPYPDVWGYELPWPAKRDRYSHLHGYNVQNGDVIFSYAKEVIKSNRKDGTCCDVTFKFGSLAFFSQMQGDLSTDEYNIFSDKYQNPQPLSRIPLPDKGGIEFKGDCVGGCCSNFNQYIVKKDRFGKILWKKHLICLLDEPLEMPLKKRCADAAVLPNDTYTARVLQLVSHLIPLDDGTILAYDLEGNVIIRFDSEFNSRSELLNRKVFLVDHDVIEGIISQLAKNG